MFSEGCSQSDHKTTRADVGRGPTCPGRKGFVGRDLSVSGSRWGPMGPV